MTMGVPRNGSVNSCLFFSYRDIIRQSSVWSYYVSSFLLELKFQFAIIRNHVLLKGEKDKLYFVDYKLYYSGLAPAKYGLCSTDFRQCRQHVDLVRPNVGFVRLASATFGPRSTESRPCWAKFARADQHRPIQIRPDLG